MMLETRKQQLELLHTMSLEGMRCRQSAESSRHVATVENMDVKAERCARDMGRHDERNELIYEEASRLQRLCGGQVAFAGGFVCSSTTERLRDCRALFAGQVEKAQSKWHESVEAQLGDDIIESRADVLNCQQYQNELLESALRQERLWEQLELERQRVRQERSKMYDMDRDLQELHTLRRQKLHQHRDALRQNVDSSSTESKVVQLKDEGAPDRVYQPQLSADAVSRTPTVQLQLGDAKPSTVLTRAYHEYVPPSGTRQFEVYQKLRRYEMEIQGDLRLLEQPLPPPRFRDNTPSQLNVPTCESGPRVPLVIVPPSLNSVAERKPRVVDDVHGDGVSGTASQQHHLHRTCPAELPLRSEVPDQPLAQIQVEGLFGSETNAQGKFSVVQDVSCSTKGGFSARHADCIRHNMPDGGPAAPTHSDVFQPQVSAGKGSMEVGDPVPERPQSGSVDLERRAALEVRLSGDDLVDCGVQPWPGHAQIGQGDGVESQSCSTLDACLPSAGGMQVSAGPHLPLDVPRGTSSVPHEPQEHAVRTGGSQRQPTSLTKSQNAGRFEPRVDSSCEVFGSPVAVAGLVAGRSDGSAPGNCSDKIVNRSSQLPRDRGSPLGPDGGQACGASGQIKSSAEVLAELKAWAQVSDSASSRGWCSVHGGTAVGRDRRRERRIRKSLGARRAVFRIWRGTHRGARF